MLPFQFRDTSDTLLRYVTELEKLAASCKDATLDLRPVRTAVEALAAPREDYERASARVESSSSAAIGARSELRSLNKLLLQSEQKLGNGDGLPRRDWFKHQIYAPGFYTGYGVKTMPQIREGLEELRLDEAREGVRKVAAAVNALAAHVQEAEALLKKVVR